MGFKEDILKLCLQINERKAHVTNEETTKQVLIIPFLQVLGYDVFNPLEIRPEFYAEFGKKGEKVDYAIFKDGTPVMFIEAKPVTANLSNTSVQLSRYFNGVPEAELGVITNGIEYRFFTDLENPNVMDSTPFYRLDLSNLKDADIEMLSHIRKEAYTRDNINKVAQELAYANKLNDQIKNQFKAPTDDFIRFMVKDSGINTRITSKDIEIFRPILKKAIANAVIDIVNQGLISQAITTSPTDEEVKATAETGSGVVVPETSPDELQAFTVIKDILDGAKRDVSELSYKDTLYYFSVNYRNIFGWFVRLKLDTENKYIVVRLNPDTVKAIANGMSMETAPKGLGGTRVFISSVEDLKKLDKLIIACYDDVCKKDKAPS